MFLLFIIYSLLTGSITSVERDIYVLHFLQKTKKKLKEIFRSGIVTITIHTEADKDIWMKNERQ